MPTEAFQMLDDLRQSFARSSGRRKHRPFVTLSFAQSLDGCLSARDGCSFALSGEAALKLTHAIRSSHDGILVGIGTVIADDPQLNVRLVDGPTPQRVILDSTLRIRPSSRLLNDSGQKPWIFCASEADESAILSLRSKGVQVWPVSHQEKGLSIPEILRVLDKQGLQHLMVEGGAEVISHFIENECVDFAIVTISPLILGHDAAVRYRLNNAQRYLDWHDARSQSLGSDIIFWGEPIWRHLSTTIPYSQEHAS